MASDNEILYVIVVIIITLIIIYVIWLYPIIWISKDAKRRGKSEFFWGFFVMIFSIIVILLYLIIRPRGELVLCDHCGKEKLENLPQCPHCNSSAKGIQREVKQTGNKFIKVYNKCENCGEVKEDVTDHNGELLCSNCWNKETIDDEPVDLIPEVSKVETPSHTLIVEVKNKNKEPLSRVNISLQNEIEKQERMSDIDGKAIFGKIREGKYSIIINFHGFKEISQEITSNKNDRIIIELEGKANLTFTVLDTVNEKGVPGAVIKFGDKKTITDDMGIAIISEIPFGKYDIIIDKETYAQESSTHIIKDIQQEIKIFLKPDIKLSEEYGLQGEELRKSLNESMKKLSTSCDMCIPEYYRNTCFELIKLNEIIATTHVYVYAEQSDEKINALYKAAGMICKEMEIVLTNSENITEYINMADRGIRAIPKIAINPADYDTTIQAYMKDPAAFTIKYKTLILNKLQETDREITNNLQTFNIDSAANLWVISQRIVKNEKNEFEAAASLLFANILLDSTRKMFKNEEIRKRLIK